MEEYIKVYWPITETGNYAKQSEATDDNEHSIMKLAALGGVMAGVHRDKKEGWVLSPKAWLAQEMGK